MSAFAVIPAKGHSTRLPGKNKKSFHGKPIVQYSIELARNCGLFDEVCVATDDEEIDWLASRLGCKVWKRPAWSVLDTVGTQQVTMNCVEAMDAEEFDFACCIYATAPMLVEDDLRRGHTLLNIAGLFDYAMGVGAEPLRDAGAFYWSRMTQLLEGWPLIGVRTGMIVIPEDRVMDINTYDDWCKAEKMYADAFMVPNARWMQTT